jgi:hypothetical protein
MPWRSDAAAEVEVTGALAAGDSAMAGSGEAAFLVASQVGVVLLAALPPPALLVATLPLRLTALPGAALLAVALGLAFVVTASLASACRSALA